MSRPTLQVAAAPGLTTLPQPFTLKMRAMLTLWKRIIKRYMASTPSYHLYNRSERTSHTTGRAQLFHGFEASILP